MLESEEEVGVPPDCEFAGGDTEGGGVLAGGAEEPGGEEGSVGLPDGESMKRVYIFLVRSCAVHY